MPQKPVKNGRHSTLELLETRWNCSGVLHNEALPCDVDLSGLVEPLDALIIVNVLNRGQSGNADDQSERERFLLDVSNDQFVTPIDVLLVINALNRASNTHVVIVNATPESDPNGNGVFLVDDVSFAGQTSPNSRLTVSLHAGNSMFGPQIVNADGDGRFTFTSKLPKGISTQVVSVRDEIGRIAVQTQELRAGDTLADWNLAALNVVRDWTGLSNDPYRNRIVPSQPPIVAKNLAMIHAAMFDAINAFDRKYTPFASIPDAASAASPVAAAAIAAHRVASALYSDSDELAVWQATLRESLQTISDSRKIDLAIPIGMQAADAVLLNRNDDGSRSSSDFSAKNEPGHWNRTFPDYLPPLLPQWPAVLPFAVSDVDQFRPAPPPTLDSPEYAHAVDEVMRLGGLTSDQRTEEQRAIAVFWADGAGTATPPGHWNRIATDVIVKESLSLVDSARTYALLNVALADAGIAAWGAKYFYDIWRPIDAIRMADLDGNILTVSESNWIPLLKTPPFPSYVSGHSTFSQAAATVLAGLFGDQYAFTSSTDGHTGLSQRPIATSIVVTRHFISFAQAALEAGVSRVYGGIHFTFDNTAGLDLGKRIGEESLAMMFKKR